MYRLSLVLKKTTATVATLVICAFCAAEVYAQGKQAIVIMRPASGASSASDCEGTTEINYQIVKGVRVNNKDDIRLISGISATESANVSRKVYEKAGKSRLQDLSMLEWGHDGLLYAVSLSGQAPILALPDNMRPPKNSDPTLSSFYSVMLSGETRDGKQKRQLSLALRQVWKVYFVPEGASVNDTFFKHAAEEKSVSLWEAYLGKTSNYRANEANPLMRDALLVCARADLERFNQGDYGSLEKARQKVGRAQAVKDDDSTRQLSMNIRQSQEKVDSVRNQTEQLIKADKWDEAITAAEAIKIYLNTWPDLNEMYNRALKQSHEMHLFKGGEALRANQLEVARDNCTIAWQRLPNSAPARTCVCEARNRITLRDSQRFRQQKRPKDAKELLEKQLADSDCVQDARVVTSLKETNCEYSQQLFAEARQLIGGSGGRNPSTVPRPTNRHRRIRASFAPPQQSTMGVKYITAQNKRDFREARARLLLASQLCTDDSVRALLDLANRRLSEYCLAEARKAMQRGDDGTAYVYLQAAQQYTPGDGAVSALISEARERFAQKTQVHVGTVFVDRSGDRYAASLINDVSSEVESVAAGAGLNQPVMLGREQAANTLRAIQAGRPLNSPTVIFFGELLTANVRGDQNSRNVPSTYQYYNPQRKQEDQAIDEVKNNYNNCRRQSGEAACGGYAEQIARMRAHRDSLPRYLTESYYYRETSYRVQGNVRMSFRSTSSISRGVSAADMLGAAVDQQCVQQEGMRDSFGNYVNEQPCNVNAEETYISQMTSKVASDARGKAYTELSALPLSYYSRARSAANRQQAVEDYLRFLFLTSDKSSNEAQQAQKFLVSYDPELKTDGVLR